MKHSDAFRDPIFQDREGMLWNVFYEFYETPDPNSLTTLLWHGRYELRGKMGWEDLLRWKVVQVPQDDRLGLLLGKDFIFLKKGPWFFKALKPEELRRIIQKDMSLRKEAWLNTSFLDEKRVSLERWIDEKTSWRTPTIGERYA